jgi:hypothetical protein
MNVSRVKYHSILYILRCIEKMLNSEPLGSTNQNPLPFLGTMIATYHKSGNTISLHTLSTSIEGFFDRWNATWPSQVGGKIGKY